MKKGEQTPGSNFLPSPAFICKNQRAFLPSCVQIWINLSNAPMSAPSTCSSTRYWTPSSRAWPTAATPRTPSTRECASAAGRTDATSLATTSTRSGWPAVPGCTSRLGIWCLTKVNLHRNGVKPKVNLTFSWRGKFVLECWLQVQTGDLCNT